MDLTRKLWLALFAFVTLLSIAGFLTFERQGLLSGFLLGMGLVGFVFYQSDSRWIQKYDAQEIEGQDPWGLSPLVKKLAETSRVYKPRIFVIRSEFPTAFSLGPTPTRHKLVVSTGLLEMLESEEVEAVLAFQMANLKRSQSFWICLVTSISEPLHTFAAFFDRILGRLKNRNKGVGPTFSMLLPVIGGLERVLLPWRTTYETDKMAAALLHSNERWAKTLWKLESYSLAKDFNFETSLLPNLVVNPLTARSKGRYLGSQPKVSDRIRQLVGRYPL